MYRWLKEIMLKSIFNLSLLPRVFRLQIVLILMLFLSACATNRDSIAKGLPTPDSGFTTGTTTGYSVYIWDCYQAKHIVIFNITAEFTSQDYERQESTCGDVTSIEKQLADDESKRDLDPNYFWR